MLSSADWRFLWIVVLCFADANNLMSSANCARWVFGVDGIGISQTYRMKRMGLSELPCGTPWLSLMSGDVIPRMLKKMCLSERKL